MLRTMPSSESELSSLDEFLEKCFLPALTGRASFTRDEMVLLRLPARLGGIGLPDFARMVATELEASLKMTEGQVKEIILQSTPHEAPAFAIVHKMARNTTKRRCRKHDTIFLEKLRSDSRIDSRHLNLLSAKGSFSMADSPATSRAWFFVE